MMKAVERRISLVLCLVMLLSLLPMPAWAEELPADGASAGGSLGDNLRWTLEDGVLTFSGEGDMPQIWGTKPWEGRGSIRQVVLEEGVTSICRVAFFDLEELSSVSLPNSLQSIGMSAFADNSLIETLHLPAGVTTLERGCFENMNGLESITVDENNAAFCAVDGVLFSKDRTTLLWYPANRPGSAYRVPDGVTTIAAGAFRFCYQLQELSFPATVTTLESAAVNLCNPICLFFDAQTPPAMNQDAFAYSAVDLFVPDSALWRQVEGNLGADRLSRHYSQHMISDIAVYMLPSAKCTCGDGQCPIHGENGTFCVPFVDQKEAEVYLHTPASCTDLAFADPSVGNYAALRKVGDHVYCVNLRANGGYGIDTVDGKRVYSTAMMVNLMAYYDDNDYLGVDILFASQARHTYRGLAVAASKTADGLCTHGVGESCVISTTVDFNGDMVLVDTGFQVTFDTLENAFVYLTIGGKSLSLYDPAYSDYASLEHVQGNTYKLTLHTPRQMGDYTDDRWGDGTYIALERGEKNDEWDPLRVWFTPTEHAHTWDGYHRCTICHCPDPDYTVACGGGKGCPTLQMAINRAARSDGTVLMEAAAEENVTIAEDQTIRLVMNGRALYGRWDNRNLPTITNRGDLEIEGGTVKSGDVAIENSGRLVLRGNVTVSGQPAIQLADGAGEAEPQVIIYNGKYYGEDCLFGESQQLSRPQRLELRGGIYNGKLHGGLRSSLLIYGGRFTQEPQTDDLAPGKKVTETTEDEKQLYVVSNKSKYLLTVTPETNDVGQTWIEPMAEGNRYMEGELVTVVAEAPEGYQFAGWYMALGSAEVLLSQQSRYAFPMPSMRYSLKARFVVDATAQRGARLEISGPAFSVNRIGADSAIHSHVLTSGDLGEQYTVRFRGDENDFLYWKNGSDRIVSRSPAYTFRLTGDTTLVAATKSTNTDASPVLFLSSTEQILSLRTYHESAAADTIAIPASPGSIGYTFLGWQIDRQGQPLTGQALQNAIKDRIGSGDITLYPAFARDNTPVSVTIRFVDQQGDPVSTMTDLHVEATVGYFSFQLDDKQLPEGWYLQGWEYEGSRISTTHSAKLMLVNSDPITLLAVLGQEEPTEEPTLATLRFFAEAVGDDTMIGRICFISSLTLPKGTTVVEKGVLRTTTPNVSLTLENASETDTIKRLQATSTGQGTITYNLPVKTQAGMDTVVYVRAYAVLQDENGLHTIYTDPVASGSYRQLLGE